MRVEPPVSDRVPSGRWQRGASEPGEERSREQEARADLRRQLRRNRRRAELRRHKRHRAFIRMARDLSAKAPRGLEHRSDVVDLGQVNERHRLVGQKRRRDHRQRRVLVAGHAMRSRDPVSALDRQLRHAILKIRFPALPPQASRQSTSGQAVASSGRGRGRPKTSHLRHGQ